MSDTLKDADHVKELLEQEGAAVVLFKSDLGSYSAVCVPFADVWNAVDGANHDAITDDFEPSQALYRLTEKVLRGVVV